MASLRYNIILLKHRLILLYYTSSYPKTCCWPHVWMSVLITLDYLKISTLATSVLFYKHLRLLKFAMIYGKSIPKTFGSKLIFVYHQQSIATDTEVHRSIEQTRATTRSERGRNECQRLLCFPLHPKVSSVSFGQRTAPTDCYVITQNVYRSTCPIINVLPRSRFADIYFVAEQGC